MMAIFEIPYWEVPRKSILFGLCEFKILFFSFMLDDRSREVDGQYLFAAEPFQH